MKCGIYFCLLKHIEKGYIHKARRPVYEHVYTPPPCGGRIYYVEMSIFLAKSTHVFTWFMDDPSNGN